MPADRALAPASVSLAAAAVLLASGCASPAQTAATEDRITIVTSTEVYADIARSVAGDHAEVESLIVGTQDPHEYEATARDRLAIAEADIVVHNGGGYDAFVSTILEAENPDAEVFAGIDYADGEHTDDEHADDEHAHDENEHVWYDPHVMGELAHALAEHLAAHELGGGEEHERALADFEARLAELDALIDEVHAEHEGAAVAVTEPLPLLLFEDLGLDDRTPEGFAATIEHARDVAPADLQRVLDLMSSGEVRLLAYSVETEGPQTQRVREAAVAASVPVVPLTENLPEGADYVEWMTGNVEAIRDALAAEA